MFLDVLPIPLLLLAVVSAFEDDAEERFKFRG